MMKAWLDLAEKVQQIRSRHPYAPVLRPFIMKAPHSRQPIDEGSANAIPYTPTVYLTAAAKNMVITYLNDLFFSASDMFHIDISFSEWYRKHRDETKWRVLLDKAVEHINQTVTRRLLISDETTSIN